MNKFNVKTHKCIRVVQKRDRGCVGVVVAQLGWHRNCRLLEDSRTLVLGNEGKG